MPFNQPKRVYRFRRFSATTMESLCQDSLHFADPGTFNDPLDCQPSLEADSDLQSLRKLVARLVERRVVAETVSALKNANVEGEKAQSYATRRGERAGRNELAGIAYNATNPGYDVEVSESERRLLASEIEHELLKRYDRGVCCFSAGFSNPLLWSHYGDEHRGLCIGYSLDRLPEPQLHRVEYGGCRSIKTSLIASAVLDEDARSQQELDSAVLLKKAPSWRYEREWRLFGNRGIQDSAFRLTDITFGVRCPDAVQHAVVSPLRDRGEAVGFFEMHKVSGSFQMKRSPVDLDEMRAFLPHTAHSAEEDFGDIDDD